MPETSADSGVLNQETVRKLAQSMQIALTEEEVATLTTELTDAIEQVLQLDGIVTDEIPPTSHPIPVTNVMRADEVREVLTLDEALQNAPEVTDGMFRVTSIMGGEHS